MEEKAGLLRATRERRLATGALKIPHPHRIARKNRVSHSGVMRQGYSLLGWRVSGVAHVDWRSIRSASPRWAKSQRCPGGPFDLTTTTRDRRLLGVQNHHGLTECGSLDDAVSLPENRLISRCPNQVELRQSAKTPASDMHHGYPGFWVAIGCALILALSTDEPQQQLAWTQTLWLHHQLSTTGRLSTVV